MPQAILVARPAGEQVLDSALDDAVHSELLPAVAGLLGELPPATILDASTWGNALVFVTTTARNAVVLADGLRTLLERTTWQHPDLGRLNYALVLNVWDVSIGRDTIRRPLGVERMYASGTAITFAHQLAGRLPAGPLWLTRAAYQVINDQVILPKHLQVAAPTYSVEVARVSHELKALCRGGDAIPDMVITQVEIEDALRQVRSSAIRQVMEIEAAFRAVINEAGESLSDDALRLAWERCLVAILDVLSLRCRPGEEVGVDIMVPDQNDRLDILATSDPEHRKWLPEMTVAGANAGMLSEPTERSGLAVHVFYQNSMGAAGVGIAPDVRTSADIVYYQRNDGGKTFGAYELRRVPSMYRAHPSSAGATAPYRSLLCAPIQRSFAVPTTDSDDERDLDDPTDDNGTEYAVGCAGVLNFTSSLPNAFSIEDIPWADAAGTLLGTLFSTFHYARREDTHLTDAEMSVVHTSPVGASEQGSRSTISHIRDAFRWIQLSDLHYGAPDNFHKYKLTRILEALCADIKTQRERRGAPDFVFFTGDVSYSGTYDTEYRHLVSVIQRLADSAGVGVDRFRFVPGNHDCDRRVDADDLATHFGLRLHPRDFKHSRHRARLLQKLDGFARFLHDLGLANQAALDWCEDYSVPSIDGSAPYKLKLCGLSTCWVSDQYDGKQRTPAVTGDSHHPNMLLSDDQLRLAAGGAGDVAFLLTHHPATWLHPECAHEFNSLLATPDFRAVHLSGHVHIPAAQCHQIFGRSGNLTYSFSSGAAHAGADEVVGHGYSWGTIAWNSPAQHWKIGWAPRIFRDALQQYAADTMHGDQLDGYVWNDWDLPWSPPVRVP